jgi:elongation factor Ts
MNMSVSIEQIKQLRDATGISMTACKKALEEANGDYDEAITLLRKKGEAKAADRAERGTGNGSIVVKTANGKTAMVKLGCETDFVAISDEYIEIVGKIADMLLNGEISVEDRDLDIVKDAVLKLGENIQIADMALFEGGSVGDYVHSNRKIGVVVSLDGGNEELAKDLAMHVAATNPSVISPEEISEDLVAKEKEIWTEQLKNEGKPAEIIDKIMMGKEKKFREESALIKQPFVKNPDKTVEQLLSEADAMVKEFTRYMV